MPLMKVLICREKRKMEESRLSEFISEKNRVKIMANSYISNLDQIGIRISSRSCVARPWE